jgi:DNA-directed RNA polymerase specialized sigma24 family protein
MDHAVENASGYLARHPGAPFNKVRVRVKSEIRRRAKQIAARRKREDSYGSLRDLEAITASQPEIEQRIYANELFDQLSPFAQAIVDWRWHGYSWREIARDLEMDHTAVRRAYFRELESLLRNLYRTGESLRCD